MRRKSGRPIVEGFKFGRFELDTRQRELRKDGYPVRLQDQPLAVLTLLVQQAGDLVTREDLRSRLWPDGTFVDFEHGLNAAVKRLRTALGENAERPRLIETLPRRGYRFIAQVDRIGHAATGAQPHAAPSRLGAVKPRLAVLPLSVLGGELPAEYFVEGLTEELITQLGRAAADHVAVIARTSSMTAGCDGMPAGDVGRLLQADYMVAGRVRRDGDRVRVTVQLVETGGSTQLWANSYDCDLADCLAAQSQIAGEIVRSLAIEIVPDWRGRTRSGSADSIARHAFLKGRYHWNRTGPGGLKEAAEFFEEAVARDPHFVAAWSTLARTHLSIADYYLCKPRRALDAARHAAERALSLDPTDADAQLSLAEVQRSVDRNSSGAEARYRRALAANPSNVGVHRYYALFLAVRGRWAEAEGAARRAASLDPLCLVVNTNSALVHYLARDYDRAAELCHHVLDMEPEFRPAHRVLAAALSGRGETREAVHLLETVVERQADPVSLLWLSCAQSAAGNHTAARRRYDQAITTPGQYVSRYHMALAAAALHDLDRAFELLAEADDDRDPALENLTVEPRFEALRADTRYRDAVSRLGFA